MIKGKFSRVIEHKKLRKKKVVVGAVVLYCIVPYIIYIIAFLTLPWGGIEPTCHTSYLLTTSLNVKDNDSTFIIEINSGGRKPITDYECKILSNNSHLIFSANLADILGTNGTVSFCDNDNDSNISKGDYFTISKEIIKQNEELIYIFYLIRSKDDICVGYTALR